MRGFVGLVFAAVLIGGGAASSSNHSERANGERAVEASIVRFRHLDALAASEILSGKLLINRHTAREQTVESLPLKNLGLRVITTLGPKSIGLGGSPSAVRTLSDVLSLVDVRVRSVQPSKWELILVVPEGDIEGLVEAVSGFAPEGSVRFEKGRLLARGSLTFLRAVLRARMALATEKRFVASVLPLK